MAKEINFLISDTDEGECFIPRAERHYLAELQGRDTAKAPLVRIVRGYIKDKWTIRCRGCGKKLTSRPNFCPHCGQRQDWTAARECDHGGYVIEGEWGSALYEV